MRALVFPGQGSQHIGMGKELYESRPNIKELMNGANDILGFNILKIMFEGTNEDLKETKVTQPAIFIVSVASSIVLSSAHIDAVAGHSLGEFSALVGNGVLTFSDGLRLVQKRAEAMQEACERYPSSMAVILGLEDKVVEDICKEVNDETKKTVVPANYNCEGQLVISGDTEAIEKACELAKEKRAKTLLLPVHGAFHSPLMQDAQEELAEAIMATKFNMPTVPIYQNITAKPTKDIEEIKENLIKQLTGPVKWTQSIKNMIHGDFDIFIETGPGKTLQGLIRKIDPSVEVSSFS